LKGETWDMPKFQKIRNHPAYKKKQLLIDLIDALEIRQKQINAQILNPESVKYPLHLIHHSRDVFTVLAVLKGDKTARALVDNMPGQKDLPIEPAEFKGPRNISGVE
jgi:hypothetical protein